MEIKTKTLYVASSPEELVELVHNCGVDYDNVAWYPENMCIPAIAGKRTKAMLEQYDAVATLSEYPIRTLQYFVSKGIYKGRIVMPHSSFDILDNGLLPEFILSGIMDTSASIISAILTGEELF